MNVSATVQELAAFLRGWADLELREYNPTYDRIARALAEDDALLTRIAQIAPRQKLVPVLLFAAVHRIVLGDPSEPLGAVYQSAKGDAWPLFRSLLERRFDEVADLVRTRRIQTNEVGRTAALFPALATVARDVARPLAIIEVGASAGLNLQLDQFAYVYDGCRTGNLDSSVEVVCELRGPLLPPSSPDPLDIASRLGIDLDPVDITEAEPRRWLDACVWPGDRMRSERLHAAIDLARRASPTILRGDARDLLPRVLDELPPEIAPCIVTSWVLAYLPPDGRRELGDMAAHASTHRDVSWVTFEYAGIPPWLQEPPARTSTPGSDAATLLSCCTWHGGLSTSKPLAWVHSHGRWMEWLDEASGVRRSR